MSILRMLVRNVDRLLRSIKGYLLVAIIVLFYLFVGYGVKPTNKLFNAIEYNGCFPIRLPLMFGAEVNARKYGIAGMTPLVLAIEKGCGVDYINELIDAGADVNVESADGLTPLMLAATMSVDFTLALPLERVRNIAPDIIRILIKSGARVDQQEKTGGRTALMLAAKYSGNLENIKSLIEGGANADIKDAIS